MHRLIALAILLLPVTALAQQPAAQQPHAMPHDGMAMDHTRMSGSSAGGMPMNHMQMMGHAGMMHGMGGAQTSRAGTAPSEPGQAAFGAIQEIVQIIEADPRTDWSKVDIDALRQHLVDMNNVTLAARVASEPIDGGVRFTVTGNDAVRDSIRRMTSAHAATLDGVDGWHFTARDTDGGSIFDVRVPPQDMIKLKGLGFFGVMTVGMHHQEHHLMIARGEHPHQ